MNEFFNKKIPVCNSVKELKEFLARYSKFKFCLYLAYKDPDDWDRSTSRVYMNQVIADLIYLPVNIKKDNNDSLKEIYRISESSEQIVAINQTQPHKSNSVLGKWLQDDSIVNIDALIKDKNKKLVPYDLNGPSFVGWFKDEVGQFQEKCVILLGVGGVGEPIARKVIEEKPSKLILVDIVPKNELCAELSKKGIIEYASGLSEIKLNDNKIIFINCAGKEGVDESGTNELLMKFKERGFIFVDLRPHLQIDIVEKATKLRWKAYTGHGMNARNDYSLLTKIAELIGIVLMPFDEFKKIVAKAS
ncbi:MAG: hypothetical protein KAQ64_01295 [Candidatus Pacebacteria bacterium]|nr:hypothetical protein [Candidatus Paceibacterota bacterium]